MRPPPSHIEIVLGCAVVTGCALALHPRADATDTELMRAALRVFCARFPAARAAHESILVALESNDDDERIASLFRWALESIEPIHDREPREPVDRATERMARDHARELQDEGVRQHELLRALELLCALEPHDEGKLPSLRRVVENALDERGRLTDYARALDDRGLAAFTNGVLAAERAHREGRP